jgi:hypothetical protein
VAGGRGERSITRESIGCSDKNAKGGLMTATTILIDGFQRVRDALYPALGGLTSDQLAHRPSPESNSVAWLVWHLARIQDAQVAALAGVEQVWLVEGWVERFALPLDPADTGYGHDATEVAAVVADADRLLGYFEATHAQTIDVVAPMSDADLQRIVDQHWDPPVTAAVRLMSIISDDLQHVGQVAYLRGMLLAE